MRILALDVATTMGWALGIVGVKTPAFGSVRFASRGASHAAIFADALQWASKSFAKWQPNRIVIEAPLPGTFKRGQTNLNTAIILHGLPAIMQAVAICRGITDIREATAKDVRVFFLGNNPKRDIAKPATVKRCRLLGWQVEDDNQADACALWMYACAFERPALAIRPTPLFSGHAADASELS